MTIDERISSELRRHAPKVDEQFAWERFQSAAPERHRVWTRRLVPVAAAVLGVVLFGLVLVLTFPWDPAPVAAQQSPFRGVWVTTDGDGSTMTMTVEVSSDGVIEITALDDYASVCSGAASTMTGSGRLESETELVIPTPVLTCDDGSEPQALSGPPLAEQLLDLTFVFGNETETLTDSFGSVWAREGAEDPSPEPTPTGLEPTEMLGMAGMWPQSSLEEVQKAQELADAGDPEYTWQVDPNLVENLDSEEYLGTAEIFSRFLEELGWEDSVRIPGIAGEITSSELNGTVIEVTFIRCAPGKPNATWPDHPRFGGCAPTIDEFHYETLSVFASQPARLDPSGIWVVNWWAENPPTEQVVPLTETEATALLEAFLQARIDGEGAEQYLADAPDAELLYATSTGAPYERYEYQLVAGPEWPNGYMDFEVQMFAEGGQILEQAVDLSRNEAGDWVLGPHFHGGPESGEPLPDRLWHLRW